MSSSASRGPSKGDGNPFDLSDKKSAALQKKDIKSRTYTESEKAALLESYMVVPQTLWPKIRNGTHVRYITKEGLFRSGGFVKINPYLHQTTESPEPERALILQNGFGKATVSWPVVYSKTETIYAKPDVSALIVGQMLEDAVAGLNVNVKKLADYVKKLESRLADLEKKG